MNGAAMHEYMTQVTEATSKKLSKIHFAPSPCLETLKDIGTRKSTNSRIGQLTVTYHHANFHADWHDVSVPGQKNTYFPYRGLPWGLLSHVIHFSKALIEPMLCPI